MAEILLRVALAFSFFYVAFSSFTDPTSWIGFFPSQIISFLSPILSSSQVLAIFSATEVALALWLLSGMYLRWAAIASALLLAGIVVVNIGALEIVFRDISLAICAVALSLLAADKKH
ncbi:MAG: DoxX family membrane protein [bacterium]|nr:DoxX family membrane protein [bacterium]MDZ4231696.1 DoxX family membrane protein [Candidatus Pacearchaeota archaeon]